MIKLLKLILGRAGSGKTAGIMEQIRLAASEEREGLLLLVPEQYSHEAERELSRVCGDRLCLFAEVLSFTRLASRVFEELGASPGPQLDKGGRLLAMSLAVSAVAAELRVYAPARRSAELQAMLLDTVTELKTAAVTPEELDSAAQAAGDSLAGKLADLSLLYDAYETIISRSAADPADRLSRLAELIPESRLGSGGIFIDGFTDFTGQELEVIAQLLRRGVDLTVCLTCDELVDGAEIFEPSRRAALRLLKMAAESGHACFTETLEPLEQSPQTAKPPALTGLERQLFSGDSARFEDREGAIRLFSAPSLTAECELAASLALELVRDRGCRWRDIAVAVRGFEDYRVPLESIFSHYGVPLYSGGKTELMKKPLPALISGAFSIIAGGWDSGDVLAYLKTGLTGVDLSDCDLLENYILMWSIRGSGLWCREQPWTMHPEGFSATTDASEALERLNRLRQTVAAPLSALETAGRSETTAAGHAEITADFLERLGLAARLEERAEKLDPAAAIEQRQLWDILVGALEQCAAVLGELAMTQEEFGRLFCLVLSRYDVGSIPAALDQVSAGDFDRMRRRHIRHLIVLGASEDRLPRQAEPAGIFSDDERELLGELGLPLGDGRAGSLYRELNLIYNCLTLPSESLTVSFAGGGEGERRPSLVMHRLSALTSAAIKPFSQAAARTAAEKPALELAACAMNGGGGSEGAAALEWFGRLSGRSESLDALKRAAALSRGSLSRRSVELLYGRRLRLSASKADTFSACRFKYFLQFGLQARPRKKAGFDPPELGTFMHYVLEGFTREVIENGGFKRLDSAERDKIADRYVEKYVHERLNDFRDKSQRFVYLFRRLTSTVRKVARDMAEELSRSDFVPIEFELDFSGLGSLPPVAVGEGESEVYLTGIADRVDGWLHEDRLYLRVVDYKTGRKSFDFTDIWNGMSLQLLMYLFSLTEIGSGRYGHEIVPAGVLYSPARDVLVKAGSDLDDGELESQRLKALVRSGLILEDEAVIRAMENGDEPQFLPVKYKNGAPTGESLASLEQLGKLSRHIEKTLSELALELRQGSIDADPYFRRSATENACEYCEYYDACQFDETKDNKRRLPTIKAPEFWSLIEMQQDKESLAEFPREAREKG